MLDTPTPLVTVTATYSCAYWPEECSRCGAEVHAADGAELDYTGPYHHGGGPACTACGPLPLSDVSLSNDPAEWGGYCDPSNPWGTVDDTYDPDRAVDYDTNGAIEEQFDDLVDAAEFLAAFPGGIWDHREAESSQNYRTGVDTYVTAHVDGPGAVDALNMLDRMES